MGMAEGLSGLADGVNDAGLAASLTFGGRAETAPGFGVPLIMRYLLEVADDVDGAVEVLRAVPCHMAYNITVADRAGKAATVFLAPGGGGEVTDRRLATNHQPGATTERRPTRTFERERRLERLLASGADVAEDFLRAPLFSCDYHRGFGTVYTAAYRPATGAATLSWREGPPQTWRIDAFAPSERRVTYSAAGSSSEPQAAAQAQPAASPEQMAEFFATLAGCLAGRRDWAGLGAVWEERSAA
jgi:predicted choloylglycine hydrolase